MRCNIIIYMCTYIVAGCFVERTGGGDSEIVCDNNIWQFARINSLLFDTVDDARQGSIRPCEQ